MMSLFFSTVGQVLTNVLPAAGTAFVGVHMPTLADGANTILSGNFESDDEKAELGYYQERTKIGKTTRNEEIRYASLLEKHGKANDALTLKVKNNVASYEEAKQYMTLYGQSFSPEELDNYFKSNYPREYNAEMSEG